MGESGSADGVVMLGVGGPRCREDEPIFSTRWGSLTWPVLVFNVRVARDGESSPSSLPSTIDALLSVKLSGRYLSIGFARRLDYKLFVGRNVRRCSSLVVQEGRTLIGLRGNRDWERVRRLLGSALIIDVARVSSQSYEDISWQ